MDNFAVDHRQLDVSEQVRHWILLGIDVEMHFYFLLSFYSRD